MKYAKDALNEAISKTGLPSHHQKALRELVLSARRPILIGYLLYALGFILLASFAYVLYLRIQCKSAGVGLSTELDSANTLIFVLAMVMFGGAQEYISRAKTSRAVFELLMREKNSEQTN